jgi:hypothetical protein
LQGVPWNQAALIDSGDLTVSTKLSKLSRGLAVVKDYAVAIIKGRFDRRPLDTVDRLIDFNHMRAAYVAQTSLYGYLKTRMGSKYVELFQDETYVVSINKAKWSVYASCLADLTLFSCALVHRDGGLERDATADFAIHCFRRAVEQTFEADVQTTVGAPAVAAFEARARLTDWPHSAEGENAFGRSPSDLIANAPVIEEFKELDAEIVKNSMRFRWRDVRDQLRQRLSGPGVAEDWSQNWSKR